MISWPYCSLCLTNTAFIVLHINFYCTFIKLPSMRIVWHSKRTSAFLETSCRLLNELAWPLFCQLISARRKSSNSLKQSWATFSKPLRASEQRMLRWSRSHIFPSHVFKSTLGLFHESSFSGGCMCDRLARRRTVFFELFFLERLFANPPLWQRWLTSVLPLGYFYLLGRGDETI